MPGHIVRADLARGELSRSYPDEFSSDAIVQMTGVIDVILREGGSEVPDRPDYCVTGGGTATRALIVTLLHGQPAKGTAILTIAICASSRDSLALWSMLHDGRKGLRTRADEPPAAPWLAERIEPGAVRHMGGMEWTGGWSRCLAWAWLGYNR